MQNCLLDKYLNVDLYDDCKLTSQIGEIVSKSEMSSFERSFLCGLIKGHHPRKILEVGVAAGATTAIILKCLLREGFNDTSLSSVDYSESYYLDPSKKSGYLAMGIGNKMDWKLYCGHTVAAYLDNICEDGKLIDFLILDTMHILPGEILDFIACLPYLSDQAVVVMHDVSLNLVVGNCYYANATRILFSAVSGKKIYMNDPDNDGFSNISAFIVDQSTRIHVLDLVSSLHVTWDYLLDEWDLNEYRSIIKKNYPEDIVNDFDRLVERQRIPILEKKIYGHYRGSMAQLVERMNKHDSICIYGAGLWGKYYYMYAKIQGITVRNIVVSDDQNISEEQQMLFDNKCVHLSELEKERGVKYVILAVDDKIYDGLASRIEEREDLVIL